jgi:hypothetical protein
MEMHICGPCRRRKLSLVKENSILMLKKFFLNAFQFVVLGGHAGPVIGVDAFANSGLLVTSAMEENPVIKIWSRAPA